PADPPARPRFYTPWDKNAGMGVWIGHARTAPVSWTCMRSPNVFIRTIAADQMMNEEEPGLNIFTKRIKARGSSPPLKMRPATREDWSQSQFLLLSNGRLYVVQGVFDGTESTVQRPVPSIGLVQIT
ncbi:hypothetical protein MMC29_007708, partial [Sticta canariensis]|nr:hypothetical protein [Sticta canariensis]